jgi:hypothetical protein
MERVTQDEGVRNSWYNSFHNSPSVNEEHEDHRVTRVTTVIAGSVSEVEEEYEEVEI